MMFRILSFPHVGDWVFGKEYQEEDYQTTIHRQHLRRFRCGDDFESSRLYHRTDPSKKSEFRMLEQSLPNLSADRIDYNIQGA